MDDKSSIDGCVEEVAGETKGKDEFIKRMQAKEVLTRLVPRVYRARILAGAGHFSLRFSSVFIFQREKQAKLIYCYFSKPFSCIHTRRHSENHV